MKAEPGLSSRPTEGPTDRWVANAPAP